MTLAWPNLAKHQRRQHGDTVQLDKTFGDDAFGLKDGLTHMRASNAGGDVLAIGTIASLMSRSDSSRGLTGK